MNSPTPPPLPPRPPPAYPYHALPQNTIRFIRIHPYLDNGPACPIVCTLETAQIDLPLPAYEALSYCWGPKDQPRHTIYLNNNLPFEVTSNLHAALLRLRQPFRSRLFWIDAVCINQNDIPERSSQVKFMQAIYSLASTVVIYLGENILVDGVDIWPIPNLLEAANLKINKRTDLPIRHGTKDWVRWVLSPDWTTNGDLQDKRWNAIIKSVILLLQRAWFLRTWIIQEAALAKHAVVISGDYHSEWNDFYRAINHAIDLGYFSATPPELYFSLRSIERARRSRSLLLQSGVSAAQASQPRPLDLLSSFRIFQATDPRDKVFGIYSLFSDEDLLQITLEQDYELDVVTVYTQSVIDCITLDGNLDVLSLGGKGCLPEHSGLPTWVPDWSYNERARPLHPRFLAAISFGDRTMATDNDVTRIRSATKGSAPKFHISDDTRVLSLSGCIIDWVSVVGGVLDKDYHEAQPGHDAIETLMMMHKDSLDLFTTWEEICRVDNGMRNFNRKLRSDKTAKPAPIEYRSPRPYFTGESGWDVFWKTMIGGIYSFPSSSNAPSSMNPEDQTRTAFEQWYKFYQIIRSHVDFLSGIDDIVNNPETSTSRKIISGLGWGGKMLYKSVKMPIGLMKSARHTDSHSGILALHRAMICTKDKGYIGLAPRDVKVGDAVVLFEGCKMPIIVREVGNPTGGERKRYTIVGDSYIHGIMHGEVFEPDRCEMMDII